MAHRPAYDGPSLFSYGFRPFFLAAVLQAAVVVPVWLLVWRGSLDLRSPLGPVDWHVHEMIFGYAAAVIAGFLFTAVPNWTGRMPARGWPLAALAALWLAGRLAVAGLLPLGRAGVAVVDCAFLLAIATMIGVEIVAGRNWRNLKVLVPVGLLFAANVAFHVQAATGGTSARRLGLSVVLFLIVLIGGRIIPSFTRNWLAQNGGGRMPAPFGRFDGVSIASAVAALGVWSIHPEGQLVAGLLALAAALHLFRLSRWCGLRTWRSPLLAMLHLAYLFLPLGLLCMAGAAVGLVPQAAGLHLLGIGVVGGMTVAVMVRATRGHTGRSLLAGPVPVAAFGLLVLAAPIRAAAAHLSGVDGVLVAGVLWTLAYGLLALRLGPWLVAPSAGRRTARQAAWRPRKADTPAPRV